MDDKSRPTVDLHKSNEIVVDQDHLRLVGGELTNFGVTVTEEEVDSRLGLGRLKLAGAAVSTDVATTDPGLSDVVRSHWTQALASIVAGGGPAPTNLDVCLTALRTRFADEFGGWFPIMGKNRDIADIEGLPYISGGGTSKVPEPAPAPTLGRAGSSEGAGVRVGIADTPLYPHPQLAGRYQNLGEEFHLDAEMRPAAGHATFIAGLVLQRAPGASLLVRPVLDQRALGTS